MLRAKYIKQGENKRCKVITNNVDILAQLDQQLDKAGFKQVGILAHIISFVTAGRRPKSADSKATKTGDSNTTRNTGRKDPQLFG